MWNRREPHYEILHVELTRPLEPVTVPEGASGLAFVLRFEDRPVGFLMQAVPQGARLSPEELAEKFLHRVGKHILSEKIYAQKVREEIKGRDCDSTSPSLDIAICTHGRPDALDRCLTSLDALPTPFAHTRVLVIDNAPPDDRTARVVEQHPGVVYVLEPKPGLDFARNRALQESTAELLAYLDDDVVVDRCWLQGLKEAWEANPDAAAFTGPILPFELETRAQVVFEGMGGFGKSFERVRFARAHPESPTYPVGAGIFGAGANMVFRADVLRALGGFDDALDTGAPLPGGGDLDMFYRVVQAGYPLVREPLLLVYHQHRREYSKLRHQMWTWGLGTMAYITKSWRAEPSERPKIRRWLLWWLSYQLSKVLVPYLRRNRAHWPCDMVFAEILGGVVGLCGEYDRSLARAERLRRQFA
jgi:GT2 family glycosyltransferase